MNPKFNIGDIVYLKSGSPSMTITALNKSTSITGTPPFNGMVTCSWFTGGGTPQSQSFHQDSLELEE